MNKVLPIKDEEKLRRIQEELAADTTWHGERMFLLFELVFLFCQLQSQKLFPLLRFLEHLFS